jgi:Zn-finger nucleic acid-binding protein
VLLAMDDYRRWRERHFPDANLAEPIALSGQEKPSKARVCPSCQRLMTRYRSGGGESFWIDYCPACQLVWLDDGEWELLAQSGLASYLDIILSERWQKNIQSRRAGAFREDLLRERFGADCSEVLRIRDWLNEQSNWRDILAFLSESLSNKK